MPRYTDTDSEILKNFEKIISEKGAISKKAEKKPTHETRSPKEINDLYHVKPGAPKDMKYDRHIGEVAHKGLAVVLPAHDKLNGLVESDQERQNIMINLVLKPTHGHLGAKKYAESQLMGSLIRVAQDLDNQDIEDLRVLADACIIDLQKEAELKKEGLFWAIAIPVAIAIAGGLLYWQQHHNLSSLGFEQNSLTLIDELKDLANASGSGGRDTYRAEFHAQVKNAISELTKMHYAYTSMQGVISDIESIRSGDQIAQLVNAAKMVQDKPSYHDAYIKFKTLAKNVEPILTKLEENFKSEDYKVRQVKDKGTWSTINDFFGGALHGGKGLIKDDFDDVVRALPSYRESIVKILELVAGAETAEKKALADYKASKANARAYDVPTKNTPSPKGAVLESENELAQLQKQLSGLLTSQASSIRVRK